MRTCGACGESKSESEFYFNAQKGRYNYECNSCKAIYNRVRQLRAWYGLTPEDYMELLMFQEGKCAGCKREFGEGQLRPEVDHEHGGRTRGLLCNRCNSALGKLDDNADLLRALVRYLMLPPADELWETERVGTNPKPSTGSRYPERRNGTVRV